MKEKKITNIDSKVKSPNQKNVDEETGNIDNKSIFHWYHVTSKRKKITWFVFFLVSMSMSIFMISSSISDYFKYEVISKIRVFNEIPMDFPVLNERNIFKT